MTNIAQPLKKMRKPAHAKSRAPLIALWETGASGRTAPRVVVSTLKLDAFEE